MTELKKYALRLHEQCVIEISRFRGRTHASLREAAVDYGLRAGLTKDEISLNLRTAGVKYEDVENTIAALDTKRERKLTMRTPKYLRCYDDGGETIDRFTIIFTRQRDGICRWLEQ